MVIDFVFGTVSVLFPFFWQLHSSRDTLLMGMPRATLATQKAAVLEKKLLS